MWRLKGTPAVVRLFGKYQKEKNTMKPTITISMVLVIAACAAAKDPSAKLFWTESPGAHAFPDVIRTVGLDGSNVEDVFTVGSYHGAQALAVDEHRHRVYWAELWRDRIGSCGFDGTDAQVVLSTTNPSRPVGVAVDATNAKLYWADLEADKISRANLDGTDMEDLIVSGASHPLYIALNVSQDDIYWTTDSGTIKRAGVNGSGIETLVTGLQSPRDIGLDLAAGKMYWVDYGAGNIQRADLDGSNIEDVLTGLQSPAGIALDLTGGKVYWTDWFGGTVQRSDLIGSNVELVVSQLRHPADICIAIPAPRTLSIAIDIKPGSDPNSVNLKAKGVLPVGILGTEGFDVYDVDMASLQLDGSLPKEKGNSGKVGSYEDLNNDSILDLILHFPVPDLVIEPEAEELILTGMLLDGTELAGSDVVRLLHPMDGDANLDGKVSMADLCVMAGHWSESDKDWAEADFNGDGKVSIGDLTMLASNWGAIDAVAIPEPATLSMLVLGVFGLLRRRR